MPVFGRRDENTINIGRLDQPAVVGVTLRLDTLLFPHAPDVIFQAGLGKVADGRDFHVVQFFVAKADKVDEMGAPHSADSDHTQPDLAGTGGWKSLRLLRGNGRLLFLAGGPGIDDSGRSEKNPGRCGCRGFDEVAARSGS